MCKNKAITQDSSRWLRHHSISPDPQTLGKDPLRRPRNQGFRRRRRNRSEVTQLLSDGARIRTLPGMWFCGPDPLAPNSRSDLRTGALLASQIFSPKVPVHWEEDKAVGPWHPDCWMAFRGSLTPVLVLHGEEQTLSRRGLVVSPGCPHPISRPNSFSSIQF